MTKISIVYFSKSGCTLKLVEAAMAGAQAVSCEVILHSINGADIIEGRFTNTEIFLKLEDSQAIIFASPTYMGGVAAQFKAFADATGEIWCKQLWAGKFAAGITCGTSLNGDQSSTLQYLTVFASQQGMLWVGLDSAVGYLDHGINRLGCQLGVVAHVSNKMVNEADLKTAEYLGARVSRLILKSI